MFEAMKESLDQIFKAYDIRGIYPDQISADVCEAIGRGLAALVKEREPATKEVVIGHDMRPSGPELVAAFAKGVTKSGLGVINIGLASTDLLYFASGHLNLPGVMFTASHNPAEYNGIKMCLSGAAPIGAESGLDDIKAVAATPDDSVVSSSDQVGSIREMSLLQDFASHVRSFVNTENFRPLKVIADTANGMGGYVIPAAFEGLPFELEIMYEELDGTFPNHEANPIDVKNLVDLQKRVLETGADIGLAFDGDADRVFVVDEKAQPVSGSLTTALLAKSILAENPGAKVIHNLICSRAVPEVVKEAGGEPVRSRVGHSYIKQQMAELDAVFGGEHSAHYYFANNWRADSGLIAAMMVLEQLCLFDGPMSELLAPLDRYAASGEINTKVDDAQATIDKVASHYVSFEDATIDRLDGLTVQFDDWWFNLRASNTEPLLRLNLEAADDAAVEQRLAEVQPLLSS